MSTPAPGRKLSTADLATPEGRPETPDTNEREALHARVVAGPEARSVVADDAGQPIPPADVARTDNRPDLPPLDQTTKDQTTTDEEVSALFADDACHALWKRWDDIQAGFVDEPRKAVQDADSLVAETMQQLANTFARERGNLEQQWGRGDNVSTEDLRIAFRRYRSFFKRLLSV